MWQNFFSTPHLKVAPLTQEYYKGGPKTICIQTKDFFGVPVYISPVTFDNERTHKLDQFTEKSKKLCYIIKWSSFSEQSSINIDW